MGPKSNGILRVGVALCGAAGGAAAQEPPDSAALPPIVVTATRVPVRADRVSGRVTVLSGDELRAAGFVSVAEALDGVAGLTVVQTGGVGSATSLFVRGGESDYVKVLLDGVPVNEPGGAYDFAHLTLDNVERLEIVRGPVSVLYGSDAVAGVVQVFTREGAPRAHARTRGGTYGTLEAEAELAGGDETASYAVAGGWRRTDGLYDLNSGYDNTTFSGRLRVAPLAGTWAAVTLRSTNATFRYPTDGAGNVVDANQRQLTRQTTLGLDLGRRLGTRVAARLALHSQVIGGGLDDPPDGSGDTLGVYAFRSQRDLDRHGVEAWLDWTMTHGATLTGGGAYEHQRDRSTSEVQSAFGPFTDVSDADRRNWAAFAQASLDRGPVAVTAGGRLDRNQRFGTFLTWRLGASWRGPAGLRAFASAGAAFKEPTFFEQLGGSFVIGNPDLTPERAISWEAGLEQWAGQGRLRVAAAWFGQRFRDLIQYSATPVAPDGVNYVNVAAANADGLELEGELTAMPGLRFSAEYTYLRTRVTDAGVLPADDAAFRAGERLLRRPTHAWAGRARFGRGPVALVGAVRWTGHRADADFSSFPATRVELPAYTLVDLGAELEILAPRGARPGASVELHVRNLFDVTYEEAYGFRAPGRVIVAGVRIGT
jgi:vitamin B12 transporter